MADKKISQLTTANTPLTGNEELAIVQSGVTVKATAQDVADLAGGGGGIKKYVALLNQSGTSAPVATVLENTLGGTPVWTRNGTGTYSCTLSGTFTPNKTFCFAMVGPVWGQGQTQFNFGINDINNCELNTYVVGTGSVDIGNDPGNDICVEIRVYP